MRGLLAGVLSLLGGCGWPPFPGGANQCGKSWTLKATEFTDLKPLNAIFATDTSVYAVGDGGQIVVLQDNKPALRCVLTNGDFLTSIWVSGEQVFLTGAKGVYIAQKEDLCNAPTLALSPIFSPKGSKCNDVAVAPQGSIVAACDEAIAYRPRDGVFSEYTEPYTVNISVALSDKDAFIGTTNLSVYRSDLNFSSWTQMNGAPDLLRDSWYNGKGIVYHVRINGTFSYVATYTGAWIHKKNTLPPQIQSGDIKSIWGARGDETLYLAGKLASSEGFVCEGKEGDMNCPILGKEKELTGVYGNQKNVYLVGRAIGNNTGFIQCHQL